MPRAFLIDTDVASDDAVALIMALRAPDVRVVAITTVAGNVEVQQATRNALYTAELCGSSVPVFVGAEKPLRREHQSAIWFHGRDGLGDHDYPTPRQSRAGDHYSWSAYQSRNCAATQACDRLPGRPMRGYGRRSVL
jgi:purine nucleosidase